MAVRRVILQIGSAELGGNRPASEIVASGGSLATQTDFLIWDGSNWSALQPGVNSNPAIGNDRWGPEIVYRQQMGDIVGPLYLIKYCVTSTMVPIAGTNSWNPLLTGQTWSDLITYVTAAAAAANAGGDTIRIDGIVISICATEMLQQFGYESYGPMLRTLIAKLRAVLPTINYCSLGSFRDDGGATPVVLVEPHYKWNVSVVDTLTRGGITMRRLALQSLEAEGSRIRVMRTHHLTHDGGYVHFDGASLVALGEAIPGMLQAPSAATAGATSARTILLVGDSIMDGTGANAGLPPQQVAALTGCSIWVPERGVFETLQAGVNNQTSVPTFFATHGPEMTLAEKHRAESGTVWIIKAACLGAFATRHYEPFLFGVGPAFDLSVNDWAAASKGKLFDLYIRGHLRSAVDAMRRANLEPAFGPVYISLGSNDCLFGSIAYPAEIRNTLEGLRDAILSEMEALGLNVSEVKFVFSNPTSTLADVPGSVGTDVATVRSQVQEMVANDDTLRLVDLSQFETTDSIHHDATRTAQYAAALFAEWENQIDASQAQPLFVPTALELRKGLRLSQVPDSNDAWTLIQNAISETRVLFFRRLGREKIESLQSFASVKTPTTDAEILRKLAESIEIKAVRLSLMRTMPTMFLDGASQLQTWNEEAAFRASNDKVLREEIRRLEAEVLGQIEELSELSIEGSGSLAPGNLIAPDNTIAPGDTIFIRTI